MKTLAIFIHGLNVKTEIGSLRKMIPFFSARGIDVIEFNYGYLWLGGAIEKNRELSRLLAHTINEAYDNYDSVVVLGHSNGCAIMELATNHFQKCDAYVYLHPAIDSSNSPSDKVRFTQVWFNPDDIVIKLCRYVYPFKWIRKRTGWGDMGVVGYTGNDSNVTNYEIKTHGLSGIETHRAVFHRLAIYGSKIVDTILSDLKKSQE